MKVNNVLLPLKTYSNLLYCLPYSFPGKLCGCCIKHCGLKWERRNSGNQVRIRVKDNTEPSPAFLIADQTELPFLQHKSSKTHMEEMKPREAHVLKCFAGWGPERLANICLLHWFHTKCPYAYRGLFFLECLKTVLDYKLYRKKLL